MDKETNSILADLEEILNGDNISEATRKKLEALIESIQETSREAQNLSSINLSGNALADVQSLSEGLDQLDKVYADILDKEDFDFSSVFSADFKKEFGAYTDEYNKFIETVTSSPDDINACQEAFNNLASAYIHGSGVLDEVTESTKASCIAMLEQMGVSNAAAIVEQALIENEKMLEAQKYATAHGCDDLTNATYREITALIEEGTASEEVRLYLAKLALEKWNVNNEELKTKADCDRLLDLAKQAGATRNQISMLKNAIADLNMVDFTNPMGTMFSSVTSKALEKLAKANPNIKKTELYKQLVGKNKKAKKEIANINSEIEKDLNAKLNINPITPTYTGGTTTKDTAEKLAKEAEKKNKKDKSAKEKTTQEFDWLEVKLNNLVDSASKAKDKIDDLLTFGAKKKQTQKAIEETTKAIEAEYKAIKKYTAYADTYSSKAAKEASIAATKEIAEVELDTSDTVADTVSSVISGAVDTSVGVVNDALQYVGKLPYVWGGASLTTGADCSGFVQQLYKKYGVNIPHYTESQLSDPNGTNIYNKADLQPGDLVFFNGYLGQGRAGHVGLYIGNGQFVHEPRTGETAKVQPLSSRSDFVAGKRYAGISGSASSAYSSTTALPSTPSSTKSVDTMSIKELQKYQKIWTSIPGKYKQLVREGSFDIESITDEGLKAGIESYQQYWEKVKACKDKVEELEKTLRELYQTMAELPVQKRDKIVESIESRASYYEAECENVDRMATLIW